MVVFLLPGPYRDVGAVGGGASGAAEEEEGVRKREREGGRGRESEREGECCWRRCPVELKLVALFVRGGKRNTNQSNDV